MPIMYNKIEDCITNVVDQEDLQKVTLQTLNIISKTIGVTLGPYGYNVLINEPQVGHFMTKDGFTVMNNLLFQGELANIIHSLIKSISAKLVEEVGDSSTTAVLAANKLYRLLLNMIDKYNMRPKEAMDLLNSLRDYCIDYIKLHSNKVSEDLHELKDIATISINNDEKLGEIVAKAYQETNGEGFVNVKIGKGETTNYNIVKGFQINYGYIDPILINNPELKESAYDKPLVLMFDAGLHAEKWLNVLNQLASITIQTKTPIILITSSYGKLVKNWFESYALSCKNVKAPILLSLITMPNTSDNQFAIFEDLAIKLGAKIINTLDKEEDKIDFSSIGKIKDNVLNLDEKHNFKDYAGSCERIVSTSKTTTFFESHGNEETIKSRIAELRDNLNDLSAEDVLASERYRIKKRLAVLTDKLVTINVGGTSEQSKLADKALIDDAVGACKATLSNGFVRGNNIELMCALKEYMDNLDSDKVVEHDFSFALFVSVYEAYRVVRENANIDVASIETQEDLDANIDNILNSNINIVKGSNVNVISPANTDIEMIKAITSMIGLLITSKNCLTKNFNSNYAE